MTTKEISIIIFLILLPLTSMSSQADTLKGEMLFRKNCMSCHSVHKELIGPMLGSITKKKSNSWLISFIKNSQNVILSNDEYANFLYEQYNRTVMPSFGHLTENEINNILLYIESESKNKQYINENFNEMRGKTLYRNHCMTCHQLNSEDYGPSLGSIYRRKPKPWIVKFVTNSQAVIKSGDPYANELFRNFNQKIMPPFYFLDSQSIVDIVEYIDIASKSEPQVAGVNGYKLNKVIKSNVTLKSSPNPPHIDSYGMFGKIWLTMLTGIIGYIFFTVLKIVYLNLNK